MNYHYHLNENDSLTFKPTGSNPYDFELFTKGEATKELKIGNYVNNKWEFDNIPQRSTFMNLFLLDRKGFQRALKNYFWSVDEKPTVWECAWRRFTIKITKTKRKVVDSFYNSVYSGRN
jgi:hypothetical protein